MFSNLNIRKYRAIVIGIISFLVLVLAILGLNFYTSYETEANAEKVNIAGRQRMLSQRIAKSLLNTFEQYQIDGNYRIPYQELRDSVSLFDSTLNAFSNGGSIPGTTSEIFTIEKIKTEEGIATLAKAKAVWRPFKESLAELEENMQLIGIDSDQTVESQNIFSLLKSATTYVRENEAQLLALTQTMFQQARKLKIKKEALAIADSQEIVLEKAIKSLYEAANAYNLNENFQPFLRSMAKHVERYDSALLAFKANSSMFDERDEEIPLKGLTTPEAKATIDKLLSLWKPLLGTLIRLENQSDINGVFERDVKNSLLANIAYSQKNINDILKQMNELTADVENSALKAADISRQVQIAGIVLGLLIFGFIAQRFFGEIRVSDLKAEQAARETKQILDTVDQGLFLMDKDLTMGSQYSKEMVNIFSNKNIVGRNFSSYINNLVSDKDANKVKRFFNLLFDPHKKQQLLGDLNPLKKVSVQVKETDGRYVNKHLRFKFSRITDNSGISKILTAVNDISEEVRLGLELEKAAKKNEQQMELLSVILNSDANMLPLFIDNAYRKFEKINDQLKAPAKASVDYRNKANNIMALIHSVKGESAAISLAVVSDLCHEFERHVIEIKESDDVSGNDFLGLTVKLEQLISYTDLVKELYSKLFTNRTTTTEKENNYPSPNDWSHLYQFANDIAERKNKKVNLILSGLDSPLVTREMENQINTISVQLIRNSLVHGIETLEKRIENNKESVGKISITLSRTQDNDFLYIFKDDGAGINLEKVVYKAIDAGLISKDEAGRLTKKAISKLIMSPEISTSEKADFDGGRGVGMSAVSEAIEALGGDITISTKSGKGVAFRVRIKNKEQQVNTEKFASIAL